MMILTDDDVRQVPAVDVVAVIREAVSRHHDGALAAPPRTHSGTTATLAERLAFTVGADPDVLGFRVSSVGHGYRVAQFTTVFDRATGELLGLVRGAELGARRTGALGAVAADLLARADARTVGMVGAGRQAFTHLWALQAVRPIEEVRVFSRTAERREAFARRVTEELGVRCTPVVDARAAVSDADLVTLTTTATAPVVQTEWIAPGTHVATLGPKTVEAHEAPIGLAERAGCLATDSLAQLTGYDAAPWMALVDRVGDVHELSAIIAGSAPGRTTENEVTVFSSTGLAGTEVVLAAELLRRAAADAPPS